MCPVAIDRVERWDALGHRLAAATPEEGEVGGFDVRRERPLVGLRPHIFRPQLRINARAGRQAQEHLSGTPDKGGVLRRRGLDRALEQGCEVACEPLAERSILGAGVPGVPIRPDPQLHEVDVTARRRREHQIGLQCLIHEFRIRSVSGDLLLQAAHEDGDEQLIERSAVRVPRSFAQLASLVEPEAQQHRRALVSVAVAARQVLQCVESGEDGRQITAPRQGRTVCPRERVHVAARLGDQRAVAEVTDRNARQGQRRQSRHSAIGDPQDGGAMAAEEARAGDETRFRENDLLQQPGQEKAEAAAAERRHRARLHAKGARDRADHPIDRGSLLRGAGEVDAPQHRRLLEPALAESLGQKLVQRRAEEGHLLGEREQDGAARDVGLLFETPDHPRRQTFDQALELARKRPQQSSDVLRFAQRERRSPYLLPLLGRQVVEEVGEARDQVALGEKNVDRRAQPQDTINLLDAALDGAGVRRVAGACRCPRGRRY